MPGMILQRYSLLLILVILALPGSAVGQSLGGSPATTFYETATVEERPRDEATAAVTVIDRAAIEASGAQNVAELLAFAPGVHVETNGTRGGLTVARLRGGDPNFTLVLLDGVPMNDGTYQIGEVFNLEAMPVAAIERIEIVRGPLSSFYGSTGLAGAIHIVTREGTADGTRGEVELAAGEASQGRLHAAISGGGEKTSFFLAASREGEKQRIADERFELTQLQGRATIDLGEHLHLRLAGRVADWEGDDYPDASGGPIFGSGELRRAENGEASLGFELVREGEGGRLRHELSAGIYRHDLDRTSPAVAPLVPPSIEATRFTRSRLGWATTWTPRAASRRTDLRLAVGASVEREDGENESILVLPAFLGGEVAGDYDLERTTPGIFAELVAERGRWTFELGARVDRPEDAAEQLSPRLGLRVRLGKGQGAKGATHLRASVGRSFKLPSFFALASPPALGGNPELRPEVMEALDLGVEHTFKSAGQGVTIGATLFSNLFRELVDFDFATFRHVNRSEVTARGVELDLDARLGERLRIASNLTYQDVEDRATGEGLRHRPEWTGSLRVVVRPRDGIRLHLDLRHVAARIDDQIPVPSRRTVAGYELLGVAGTFRLTPSLDLDARLDNLLDEDYEVLIGFPGAGRSGRVGLRWTFGGT